MSSGKDVAHEGCYYGQEEEDHPNVSCFFVQVGAVVQASSDVKIDANEEERCTVGMYVPDKSAVVDVSANVGDGGEGCCDIGSVMYG